MSTTRRPLGTGPAISGRAELTDLSPRLLPVERIKPAALPDGNEHQEAADPKDRRSLGHGNPGPA
ncbi:hypothetical protein [Streptomyces fagopyri]|uniref:hypothetical protein n=1 Tax=Streptomyces fagopyri TaxID=2662397 RepID=UPI0033E6ACA4